VPEDVPVAGPAGRLTLRPDVWRVVDWWWHAYLGAVALAVVAVMLVAETRTVTSDQRVGAIAAIAAIAAWYALAGRQLMGNESTTPRVWLFHGVTAVLFAVATFLVSSASFLLFALTPLVYSTMPWGAGTAVVVVLNLLPSALNLARTGDVVDTAQGPLGIGLLVIAFSAGFAAWVNAIARQSTERADLIAELDASREEVARLSREAGVAAERQRLAGELHDTIAQGLSSLVMLMEAAEADLDRDPGRSRRHIRLARRAARDNLAEARALVAGLTPAELSDAALADVLCRLAARFGEETGVPVRARITGAPRVLPTAVEVVLLRAAQESLANVRKHARAGTVRLELVYGDGTAVLTVADDGVGAAPDRHRRGYGLRGMTARVTAVGGSVRVDGRPGAGTRVTVEVPA
jgi:signal transduction histidine kinase